MALESIKNAAVASAGNISTKSAEPVRVERNDGVSAAGMTPVGAASGVAAKQRGTEPGNEEYPSDQEAEHRLKTAIQRANSEIKHSGKTRCEFSYHEETKRIAIKVMDAETKELIREIPAEETLQMVEKMWELAGILVDEKR